MEYCENDERIKEIEEKLSKIDEYFTELNKPNDFNPQSTSNTIILFEKNIEQLISLLETNQIHKPDELSLFEFYGRLKFIKENTIKQTPKN